MIPHGLEQLILKGNANQVNYALTGSPVYRIPVPKGQTLIIYQLQYFSFVDSQDFTTTDTTRSRSNHVITVSHSRGNSQYVVRDSLTRSQRLPSGTNNDVHGHVNLQCYTIAEKDVYVQLTTLLDPSNWTLIKVVPHPTSGFNPSPPYGYGQGGGVPVQIGMIKPSAALTPAWGFACNRFFLPALVADGQLYGHNPVDDRTQVIDPDPTAEGSQSYSIINVSAVIVNSPINEFFASNTG